MTQQFIQLPNPNSIPKRRRRSRRKKEQSSIEEISLNNIFICSLNNACYQVVGFQKIINIVDQYLIQLKNLKTGEIIFRSLDELLGKTSTGQHFQLVGTNINA